MKQCTSSHRYYSTGTIEYIIYACYISHAQPDGNCACTLYLREFHTLHQRGWACRRSALSILPPSLVCSRYRVCPSTYGPWLPTNVSHQATEWPAGLIYSVSFPDRVVWERTSRQNIVINISNQRAPILESFKTVFCLLFCLHPWRLLVLVIIRQQRMDQELSSPVLGGRLFMYTYSPLPTEF